MSNNTSTRHYSSDDVNRLKELVREGCVVRREVEDLQGGLNDTVKAIAEEMNIKPAVLKKLINVAYKRNMSEEKQKFDELEDLVETLGLDKG